MLKLFWVFLSGTVFLAGCASTFIEPVSGPTAKLRVRSEGPVPYTWIHTFEKPNCQGKQLMGEIGNRGTHPATVPSAHNPKGMIGSAVTPDRNIIEQIIPAKQTTILFTLHDTNSSAIYNLSCKLAFSFKAEAGAEYEIKYGYSSMQCFASAERLRFIDGKVVRELVRDAKNMDDCISSWF